MWLIALVHLWRSAARNGHRNHLRWIVPMAAAQALSVASSAGLEFAAPIAASRTFVLILVAVATISGYVNVVGMFFLIYSVWTMRDTVSK